MTRRALVVFAICLLLYGCQRKIELKVPTVYPVHGRILVDEHPVMAGRVVFTPKDTKKGFLGYAGIKSDGTFSAISASDKEGLVPGHYIVSIEPAVPLKVDPKAKPTDPKGKADPKAHIPLVPHKYQSPTTSDLEVHVEDKDNDMGVIKLKGEKVPGKK